MHTLFCDIETGLSVKREGPWSYLYYSSVLREEDRVPRIPLKINCLSVSWEIIRNKNPWTFLI